MASGSWTAMSWRRLSLASSSRVEQGAVLLLALALGQGGLRVAQQPLRIPGLAMGDAEEDRDLDPVLLLTW